MTAVAVVREEEIRSHYSHLYWLTIGADLVDERIKQMQVVLYKQLTGKNPTVEDLAKDKSEWLPMLIAAIAEKQRALLVLDDPWMPEQVRCLSPIDGSQQTGHRLLITTRIRDLVPNAASVELPLMRNDEAVAPS